MKEIAQILGFLLVSLLFVICINSNNNNDINHDTIINNTKYKGENYRYTFEHDSFKDHVLVEVWKDFIYLKYNNKEYYLNIVHSFNNVDRYKYRVKYKDSHYDMLISKIDSSYNLQFSILDEPIYKGDVYLQIETTRGRGKAPK